MNSIHNIQNIIFDNSTSIKENDYITIQDELKKIFECVSDNINNTEFIEDHNNLVNEYNLLIMKLELVEQQNKNNVKLIEKHQQQMSELKIEHKYIVKNLETEHKFIVKKIETEYKYIVNNLEIEHKYIVKNTIVKQNSIVDNVFKHIIIHLVIIFIMNLMLN